MEYDADYGDGVGDVIQDDISEFDYSYVDEDHGLNEEYISLETLPDLWEFCLKPTISDGVSSAKFLLSLCFIFRLTFFVMKGKIPSSWYHLILGSTGIICLYQFFGLHSVFIVALALLGLAATWLAHFTMKEYQGVFCATVCVIFLVSCEFFIVDRKQWHQIRGSQMILTMKLISLSYDLKLGSIHPPSVIECFGYLFCIGNVIFGPWVDFSTYSALRDNSITNMTLLKKVLTCLLLSFLFLTISTCWTEWCLSDNLWTWIVVYRDALGFRSSHYFVCYLAESTALLIGISPNASKGTSPIHIELPRSLVEVVIFWNMPIHRWLKIYVFKKAKPYGTFVAIISTYAASSLLHGLNFQLAAVLLSLGFYSYIEFVLRNKLANVFDACIRARQCVKDCHHKNTKSHPYVIATNVAFGFLTVFHLAYLGVMFDSSSAFQEEGYSMQHTLSKWSDLNFASHWVALVTFLFSAIT